MSNAAKPISATVAHAAPPIPSHGIAVNVQLRMTLITRAIPILITGIRGLLRPCKIPVVTWCTPRKKIENAVICVANSALGAL